VFHWHEILLSSGVSTIAHVPASSVMVVPFAHAAMPWQQPAGQARHVPASTSTQSGYVSGQGGVHAPKSNASAAQSLIAR
jgi:hypothetical protein